jgi:hypothetical protein
VGNELRRAAALRGRGQPYTGIPIRFAVAAIMEGQSAAIEGNLRMSLQSSRDGSTRDKRDPDLSQKS